MNGVSQLVVLHGSAAWEGSNLNSWMAELWYDIMRWTECVLCWYTRKSRRKIDLFFKQIFPSLGNDCAAPSLNKVGFVLKSKEIRVLQQVVSSWSHMPTKWKYMKNIRSILRKFINFLVFGPNLNIILLWQKSMLEVRVKYHCAHATKEYF